MKDLFWFNDIRYVFLSPETFFFCVRNVRCELVYGNGEPCDYGLRMWHKSESIDIIRKHMISKSYHKAGPILKILLMTMLN